MNFVLVHGGFHGGWCWRPVADRLNAMCHRVTCPTSTGLGERRHLLRADLSLDTLVHDLVNHLQAEELSDVVLVGHSFGGLSISGAADRVPQRIRHDQRPQVAVQVHGTGERDIEFAPTWWSSAGKVARCSTVCVASRRCLSPHSAFRPIIQTRPGCSGN